MKWFIGLFLCCMLCSCGGGYENHDAIDAVNASVDALEQSLPKECKTKATESQFVAIKKELATIERDCDVAVDKANSEKVKWKTAFFGLLLAIGLWFARKFVI